ncbi:MAG: DNA cytosine methyltransferase [Jiangellaceae bacterium]
MITTAHLCSGYSGIGRGLSLLAPHETLWHAEIDPDMSMILEKHEPGVLNVGDLIRLVLDDLWRMAPVPDVLTAGFPCQPVSGAGRQLAELDPRWLWPFVDKIIEAVRPPAVFLENVQAITSIQGGAILRGILDDLRATRYAARWAIVGACAVGAPHHRHRWYLWASRVDSGPVPEAVRVGTKAFCGASRATGRTLLHSPKATDHRGAGTARMARGEDPWDDLPTDVAMLPTPAARDGGLRGTPSVEHAARRAADPMRSLNLEDAIVLLPTPRASDGPNGGPNQRNGRGEYDALPGLVVNALPEVWGKYAAAVALWEQVTGNPAPAPTEPNTKGGRRMSALLPEWMMGLPPGTLTDHLGRSAAIKAAGNGVVPLQAAAAQRLLTC